MRWIALLFVVVAFAGCAAEEPEPAPSPGTGTQYEDPDRNLTIDEPGLLPRDPPAAGERTLDKVPLWRLGEWWTYEIEDFLGGDKETITRVVAGTEHDNYLVGFPIDQFSSYALVLHHPSFGDVHMSDLSYETHDSPFKHLKFPFVEGDTWETTFESETVVWTAEVTSVDATTGEARVDFTNANGGNAGYSIYDAELGVAKDIYFTNYGRFQVVDHGFNYTGDVRVPHAHDLVFFDGRFAGVVPLTGGGLDPQNPTTPSGTITVPDNYDRVSFGLLAQDVASNVVHGAAGTTRILGYYAITVTAPDGTQYSMELTPADEGWFVGEFYDHDGPAGEWQYTAIATGAGGIFIEGIGYHSIDLQLPSGCVIASQNALHHGSLCKAESS